MIVRANQVSKKENISPQNSSTIKRTQNITQKKSDGKNIIRKSSNCYGLSSSEVDKAIELFEEVMRDWG